MTTKGKTGAKAGTPSRLAVGAELKAQREYLKRLGPEGLSFSVVVADAFVQSVRHIGYKSTATALDELIDNTIQAGAEKVRVEFGYDGKSSQPARLAVIDDGHGMDPDMIRLSMVWGGTHRHDNRDGFGRYGFGLPSAALSQGRRFTVYSRTDESDFHAARFDLDELIAGDYTDEHGQVVMPPVQVAAIPEWINASLITSKNTMETVRTVVVIEELDGVSWKTTNAMKRNLLIHFGVTYRNFLRSTRMYVDDTPVEPIDPLFLTEGARFYDLDDVRAESRPPIKVPVKANDGSERIVKVRFSYMPPDFQTDKISGKKGAVNSRFPIMKDHNGFIVLRNGRQIDVVTKTPSNWDVTFQNFDRNVGLEIDFPSALDELFAVTTSKQQITLSERMWDLLDQHGVKSAYRALRGEYQQATKVKENTPEKPGQKRISEEVMEEAAKFDPPPVESQRRLDRAKEARDQEIEKRASDSGVPTSDVAKAVDKEIKERPYKVETSSYDGAPFYMAEQRGGQKVITLNTAHRFYTDLYADSPPKLQSALELLLFVLGETELDAEDEREVFYKSERVEWSRRLDSKLGVLETFDASSDDSA